uniref:Exocyst complex component 2 n=1 Tax=Arcella intermedia TaxID=1963864 RepID=A0A6B2KY62_9EUKA
MDEPDDFLDEDNENLNNLAFAEVIEDPLGLKKKFKIPNRKQPTQTWDFSSEDFNAAQFLAIECANVPLEELKSGMASLYKRTQDRQKQLNLLVQENFHRFVACKDNIDEMYQLLGKEAEHHIIKKAIAHHQNIVDETNITFGTLLARQKEIDTIRNVLSILTRVKFKFIFSLPTMMKNDMQKKEYDKVVFHYKKVEVWLANTQVSMFQKVLQQAKKTIEELKMNLIAELSNPIKLDEEEKIIRLLVSLRSTNGAEEDPAWHCITVHHRKIIDLLSKVDKFSYNYNFPLSFESDLNTDSGNRRSTQLNALLDSHAFQAIKRLCSIIQELLPDFWNLSKAFYNREYHAELSPQELEKLDEKYSETQFSKLFNTIIDTYIKGIRYYFFGEVQGVNPLETGGSFARSSAKRRKGVLMGTLKKTSKAKLPPSVVGSEWETQNETPKRKMNKTDKKEVRNSMREMEEIYEDDDKEKVKAVIECAKVFQTLKISWEYSGPFYQLLDEMVSNFLQNTFSWTLNELKKLHLLENWEIVDRTSMVTSLPYHYVTLVKKTLAELKGVTDGSDDHAPEIEKNFSECLNSFADNMYYLAFDAPVPGKERKEEDDEDVENTRLLIILNNCFTTRTKHIPDLVKKYRVLFKVPVSTPDPLVESTNSIINQLETMVLNKYLKSKNYLISTRIKTGLLLEGFDFARTQLYNGGIRDYIIDILIHLVFVHEELHRLSPTLVNKILSTLLEFIYESFIDWMKYVDEWSPFGKFQVGLELQFIHQITENFKTEKSTKLNNELATMHNFPQLHTSGELPPNSSSIAKQFIDTKTKSTAFLFDCFQPENKPT